jgi:prepilin-type processing-associated H-X9-DG protein
MYLDENNDYFYQGVNANLSYGGWKGIVGWAPRPLNRYVGMSGTIETERDAEVFRCPSDRGGIPNYPRHISAYRNFGTSYHTNVMLVGPNSLRNDSLLPMPLRVLHTNINRNLRRVKVDKVDEPHRLLLIGDYGWINQWAWEPFPTLPTEWHDKTDYHNIAFLDGHVKFMPIEKTTYTCSEYRVLPFKNLDYQAREVQYLLQEETP